MIFINWLIYVLVALSEEYDTLKNINSQECARSVYFHFLAEYV